MNFLNLKKKKDAIWCGNSSYNISYLTLPLQWPQPWPAGTLSLGKRGMLLHVISLQGPCWAETAKWTQLSVSCDVDYCLLGRVDTSKHISFSSSLTGYEKHVRYSFCDTSVHDLYLFRKIITCRLQLYTATFSHSLSFSKKILLSHSRIM